ncbi:hypothetical protein OROHE_007723 [Orobanche hederae]
MASRGDLRKDVNRKRNCYKRGRGGRLDNSGATLSHSIYAGNPDTPNYVLYQYLCKCALDWFYVRKVELYEKLKVLRLLTKEFDAENSCYHLRLAFEAFFPADGKIQTFQTSILYKARLLVHVVIVYVGQETPQSLENLSDCAKDYISDSDDGDDREVSELNPAFIKEDPKALYMVLLEFLVLNSYSCVDTPVDTSLLECIKRLKNSKLGFDVGHYPKMVEAGIHGTWISKYYDIDNKPIPASSLTELHHLSELALCFYNMKEVTKFYNVKVLRAMTYNCGSTVYNMTFKASLSDKHEETFQTNIRTSIALPVNKIMMVFVRIKSN